LSIIIIGHRGVGNFIHTFRELRSEQDIQRSQAMENNAGYNYILDQDYKVFKIVKKFDGLRRF